MSVTQESKSVTLLWNKTAAQYCLTLLMDAQASEDDHQFTCHSFFFTGSPERARNTGSRASAARATATNGR